MSQKPPKNIKKQGNQDINNLGDLSRLLASKTANSVKNTFKGVKQQFDNALKLPSMVSVPFKGIFGKSKKNIFYDNVLKQIKSVNSTLNNISGYVNTIGSFDEIGEHLLTVNGSIVELTKLSSDAYSLIIDGISDIIGNQQSIPISAISQNDTANSLEDSQPSKLEDRIEERKLGENRHKEIIDAIKGVNITIDSNAAEGSKEGGKLGILAVGIRALAGSLVAAGGMGILIFKGGVALGAAIAAIGVGIGVALAAIGGGLWIAMKLFNDVFPAFGEMIEKFPADKALTFGLALGAIGIGLGAFAGGSFLNATVGKLARFLGGGNMSSMLDAVEELGERKGIDLKTVKHNSEAIVAYAGAMALMGGAGVGKAIGEAAGLFSDGFKKLRSLFGKDGDILDDVENFTRKTLDVSTARNNGWAITAYAGALGIMSAGGIASAVAEGAGVFSDGFAKLRSWISGGDGDIIDDVENFTRQKLDVSIARNNGWAITAYAGALAIMSAGEIFSVAKEATGVFADGFKKLRSLFGNGDIIDDVEKFTRKKLDVFIAGNNALAVASYTGALAIMTGTGIFSAIAEGAGVFADGFKKLRSLFGNGDIIDDVENFTRQKLDISTTRNNALAVASYTGVVGMLTAQNITSTPGNFFGIFSDLFGGLRDWLTGDSRDIIDDLKDFSREKIDIDTVGNNARAAAMFASAMVSVTALSALSSGSNFSRGLGSIASGIRSLFTGSRQNNIVDSLVHFSRKRISIREVENNANAIGAWATSMAKISGINASRISNTLSSINLSEIRRIVGEFTAEKFELSRIENNAEAISRVFDALGNISPTSKKLFQINDEVHTRRTTGEATAASGAGTNAVIGSGNNSVSTVNNSTIVQSRERHLDESQRLVLSDVSFSIA